jgi:hypothetical protein
LIGVWTGSECDRHNWLRGDADRRARHHRTSARRPRRRRGKNRVQAGGVAWLGDDGLPMGSDADAWQNQHAAALLSRERRLMVSTSASLLTGCRISGPPDFGEPPHLVGATLLTPMRGALPPGMPTSLPAFTALPSAAHCGCSRRVDVHRNFSRSIQFACAVPRYCSVLRSGLCLGCTAYRARPGLSFSSGSIADGAAFNIDTAAAHLIGAFESSVRRRAIASSSPLSLSFSSA